MTNQAHNLLLLSKLSLKLAETALKQTNMWVKPSDQCQYSCSFAHLNSIQMTKQSTLPFYGMRTDNLLYMIQTFGHNVISFLTKQIHFDRSLYMLCEEIDSIFK